MKSMAEIQKNDPLCPSKDKPCNRWHHTTIEKGLDCPCRCHWTNEHLDEWGKQMTRIVNIDEIVDYMKKIDGEENEGKRD